VESFAVQAIWIGLPFPKKSNKTPSAAEVKWNPVPSVSMTMGELSQGMLSTQLQVE
jgi:hypothetical protein